MRSLWIVLLLLADGVVAASISGRSGSLIYSGKINEDYHSLVFKGKSGELVRPFDVGVNYSFYSDQISPDKSYSVVNFSESGVLSGESEVHDIYLCAFVRMSDGCITAVESGGQCGGEWVSPSRWVSPVGDGNESLFNSPPSIEKTFMDYVSGRKDRSQVSNPKVMAYLLEGTSFQDLLVCDPLSGNNNSSYEGLLIKLRRDGDSLNAEAVEDVLRKSGVVNGTGNKR